jgi:hypothetical protein
VVDWEKWWQSTASPTAQWAAFALQCGCSLWWQSFGKAPGSLVPLCGQVKALGMQRWQTQGPTTVHIYIAKGTRAQTNTLPMFLAVSPEIYLGKFQ